MYILLNILLLLSGCNYICLANPVENVFQNHISSLSGLRCGGVIKDDTVTLTRPSDSVVSNERCVWIIASPGASAYAVSPLFSFNSTDHLLTISAFNKGSQIILNVSPASNTTGTIFGNVLVVTFNTQGLVGTEKGFILNITKIESEGDVNVMSRYELITPETLYVAHPNSQPYLDNELSLMVFVPENNVFVEGRTNILVYKELGIEPDCEDFVTCNEFNSTTATWNIKQRLCSGSGEKRFDSDEMTLFAFHSDSSNNSSGFLVTSIYTDCDHRAMLRM